MIRSHRDYYEPDFDWDDSREPFRPDLAFSKPKLIEAGMSESDAIGHVDSGYIFEPYSGNIIDRYYGGALLSRDMRTRFPIQEFTRLDHAPKSKVRVLEATSWAEAVPKIPLPNRPRNC